MMDLKIFVDADPDERLIRVIQRDVIERGRTAEAVMERYTRILKPMHLQFIEPSKRYADLIIPEGGNNRIAIDILTMYIKSIYKQPILQIWPSILPQPSVNCQLSIANC